MTNNTTPVKPGIRSTEFWLALVATILVSLAGVYTEAEWAKVAGIIGAALVSAGYSLSRAQVKRGPQSTAATLSTSTTTNKS